jgi:ZIP family zinc transporter
MSGATGQGLFGLPFLLLAIGLATGSATLAGGFAALRLRGSIGLLLAFSSGAVVGVALLDLLPEALGLGGTARPLADITTAAAAGFAAYFAIDRAAPIFTAGRSRHRGHLAAGSLTLHSLMDGLGIGFAFQASVAVGVVVAFAVLAHDLVDGLNTVTLSLSGGLARPTARRWLVADAAAPLVGIGVSRLVVLPQPTLALMLAVFSGFFLYIGASELLPQSRDQSRRVTTIVATLLGLALIFAVVKLAGG